MASEAPVSPAPVQPPSPRIWRWARRLGVLLALVAMTVAAGLGLLDSPLGHRVVTDRIASLAPASGLRIRIGRIDGSLFRHAVLHNVVLSDPGGRFLTIPEASLDWRPVPLLRLVMGMGGSLDIRELVLKRGTLWRAAHLRPGNPDSPILPGFDIRVDRFAVENLTVARGLAGPRRRVDLTARVAIHAGRALVDCDGRLGGRDRLALHLDSEPDHDRFVLGVDYHAPQGGLLAALTGIDHDVTARIGGRGHFRDWQGWAAVRADGQHVAGLALDNRNGRYRLLGVIHPHRFLDGTAAALAGDGVKLRYEGTFADSTLDGALALVGAGFHLEGKGAIDLSRNRANGFAVGLAVPRLAQPGDTLSLGGLRLAARFDGRFSDLSITHRASLERIDDDDMHFRGLTNSGVAHWDGARLRVPLALHMAAMDTGKPWLDRRLDGAGLTGMATINGHQLSGDGLVLRIRGLAASGALRGDMARGGYAIAGGFAAHALALPTAGPVDGTGRFVVRFGRGLPWQFAATASGRAPKPELAALATLAGGNARFTGGVTAQKGKGWQISNFHLLGNRLDMSGEGSISPDAVMAFRGTGRQDDYGPFAFEAGYDDRGPSATVTLDSPLPALGVRAARLVLAPEPAPNGAGQLWRVTATAQSRLGPLAAKALIHVPDSGATRIEVIDAGAAATHVSGAMTVVDGRLLGDLGVTGGGLEGKIHFGTGNDGPEAGDQAVEAEITARNARFGGDVPGNKPIVIATAHLSAKAQLGGPSTTLDGTLQAQGISIGGLFIGRLIAESTVVNGTGAITASLAGRRGTQFTLQGTTAFAPDRIVGFLAGDYGGNAITMPRRAIFTREAKGWRLEPSQVNIGNGALIGSGHFGGGLTEFTLAVSRMQLSALDIVLPDLGLGGYVSGQIDYRNDHSGTPAGHAALLVRGLTRSGLVLTSRPLDLALVGSLDAAALQARAIAKEGQAVRGRLQAVVSALPRGGTIIDRIRQGKLRAQMSYSGPADALWRLAAIDVFDLTGPVGIAADITGTPDKPEITGAIASTSLRVQSAVSGSDVRNITVDGRFGDSRLQLARFAGTTPGGGHVVGSGTIDLSNLTSQGAAIDLRLAATNADLINRPEMGATFSGPMRVVFDGEHGTLAGRLSINRARWALGRASAVQSLPTIATTERNTPADIAPPRPRMAPWRLLIDINSPNRLDVHGMGLESEWGANIRLRGDTANPQVFGAAEVVRGSYEFAGKRFDLTRGRIHFNGEVPIDPQLDIVATGDANDITATISIAGSAQKPTISFSSTPSLPEEELLSRILFGSSITQISAPEAVQLASAMASLRSGGGLDPINKLRGAIGLDRLRVISADATTGRGTSLAVGKYLGRRFYVELVTDGHGYSASSIEFRITRWLALLGTISTIDDESISLKVSKDY